MNNLKIGIYPGCSLETSSSQFLKSMEKVFDVLDVEYTIMKNWNCCGATSVKALDHRMNQAINLRNLALAEQQGYDELIVPCASCYHRLAGTDHELRQDPKLKDELSKETGFSFEGKVKVRNLLDFFVNVLGIEKISEKVVNPLSGYQVACYYGCLNTRLPGMLSFDVVEYPESMDKIMQAIGAETIDWSYKTECCGASMFITEEAISGKLVGKILKDANLRQADAVAVSCPMCQTNLDTKQDKIREQHSIDKPMPVPFITQLMGLAFGCEPDELGMSKNFVEMVLKDVV